MPRLAVIIPMFNSRATVAEAIESVRSQTFEGWRLIVVNDGSTDDGPAIVAGLADQDPRIELVSQSNAGLAAARNAGLARALAGGAEYLAFLDADDWMDPRGYERLLRAAGETGAAYGGYELCDEHGRSLGRQSPISAPLVGLHEDLEWNRAATHARLMSADAIGDVRFDESLPMVEDLDVWLRMECNGAAFKATEHIVAGYRLRPASMSKQFGPMCRWYAHVLNNGFGQARNAGWSERIDLGAARFERIAGRAALQYATMEALAEASPGKTRGAALLHGSLHPARFRADDLAQAASTALLFGAATAPELDGARERSWLLALRQWWARCAEDGWCGHDDVEHATRVLASKVVHPDPIVAQVLDAARAAHASEHGLVVLGVDRASRRLARAGVARGWRVLAIDAAGEAREAALLEHAFGLRIVQAHEAGAAVAGSLSHAPWVTGLERDAADRALACVHGAPASAIAPLIRWGESRDRLGACNLRLMDSSLACGRLAG